MHAFVRTMRRASLLMALAMAVAPAGAANPIIQTRFTADPAPLVHDGVVYLYTSHDEDDAADFKMLDWLLYSSTDMVNWTDHGAVASLATFPWAEQRNDAWAPQVVARNGKFYLYAPVSVAGWPKNVIAVAVADHPAGPFKDALGKPLIDKAEGYIDPTVAIDGDGQAYLYWGNPQLWHVKLNEDMVSYSGPIVKSDSTPANYQEGPWFYKRGPHYYMAYASTCCPEGIGYAMSASPTGPWRYQGQIMQPNAASSGNHPGIIDYKGNSYVFGFNYELNFAQSPVHRERRSVTVAKFAYNADGTIAALPWWDPIGVEQLGRLDPYRRVEAETIAWTSRIKHDWDRPFDWAPGVRTASGPGEGMHVADIVDRTYIKVAGVDFGAAGPARFAASVASGAKGGQIEIRRGNVQGPLLGTLTVPNTGGWQSWRTVETAVGGATGVHDVFFVFKGKYRAPLFNFDHWQFFATAPTAPTPLDAIGQVQTVRPASAPEFQYQRVANGVQFQLAGVTKTVLFYSPSVVRVNAHLGTPHWRHPSLVVIRQPEPVPFALRDDGASVALTGARVRVTIDKQSGAIAYADGAGRPLTRENSGAPQSIALRTIAGAPTYEVENRFTLKPGEGIYGFGFTADDEVNRRNKELLLVQTNVGIIIPVMMSSERYGVLWDTYSMMRFKDNADGASLWAESAPGGVDYYFMAGDSMDQVIGAYRWLTGDAPMYPKQAFGLFMSKERYPTQARLLEVARTFRREKFPLDYIVQDWQYWGSDQDGSWSGMTWDPQRFPDPLAMTTAIHGMNLKLMVSIWPSVGNDTALARELDREQLRFAPLHWISKQARVYDAYSRRGREIYFKHIKSGLLDKGVDALWMDGTEVEVSSAMWNAMDNVRDTKALGDNAMGDFTRYLNPYSLLTTGGTYQGQRASDDKRVFTLTRSAWAGAQRTAAASWSGDIFASWKTFRQQIAGGVNVTITGNPYWTQDTGGFFVTEFPGGENNPAYRELYARWFQYAAFNPIMRVHGTSIEREPYLFKRLDPPVYRSMLDAVHLRYRLLPYIYSLSAKVSADRYTLMRALPMDFAGDAATFDINDSFMFGPSLLVHPVTRAMYHLVEPPAAAVPAEHLRTGDGRRGLALQYFGGQDFETPLGQLVDDKVDHDWPEPPLAEIPGGLTSLQHFSARWQGELVAPEAGEYELGLVGDDGLRLYLGGEKVIDDWHDSASRYRNVKRVLKQGERLPLTIEYYQSIGNRALRLAWRTPSQRRAVAAEAAAPRDLAIRTYLPRGGDWYDFWTHQRYPGGTTVSREAPLGIVPLYVRAGAIIPMGPVVQYATESPGAPYEVRVYPGADGRFTLYEDDNETYAYENGQSARYDLVWSDASRTLSIGARQGAFPGMVTQRRLNIVIAGAGNATAVGTAPAARSVLYTGAPLILRFDSQGKGL